MMIEQARLKFRVSFYRIKRQSNPEVINFLIRRRQNEKLFRKFYGNPFNRSIAPT